jgi:predicted nucleic acid-binding protein
METLSFALEADDALVLIDDAVGRREARRLGLLIKGTLGVIADAYRHGYLTFSDAELLIREIESRPDIWIRSELCEQVLEALTKL